jgi:hypothetical protein
VETAVATEFKPTANQLKVLTAFADNGYDISIQDACREAGVHRSRMYRWLDDPGFREYWQEHREKAGLLALKDVDRACMNSATGENKDANTSAIKLMYERFDKGYAPRSKQEVTGKHSITLSNDKEASDRLSAMLNSATADSPEE